MHNVTLSVIAMRVSNEDCAAALTGNIVTRSLLLFGVARSCQS
jgi:hypothetical protein